MKKIIAILSLLLLSAGAAAISWNEQEPNMKYPGLDRLHERYCDQQHHHDNHQHQHHHQ